jgi:hypothetical protein
MRRADQGATLSGAQADVAATGVKALIPIGRPFLDYVLDAVAEAGLSRIGLVIGPSTTPSAIATGRSRRPGFHRLHRPARAARHGRRRAGCRIVDGG